jgi:hypothetical protein
VGYEVHSCDLTLLVSLPPARICVCIPCTHGTVLQVAAIKQGTALVLECRQQRRYDQVALVASEKLLRIVPEVGTNGCTAPTSRLPLLRAMHQCNTVKP